MTYLFISRIIPHTSHLTPHTSHLTPHTSHFTPHSSLLTPPTPVDKRIINADELRAIIKKREAFEYRLAKRSTELPDYIAAIKYEMLLQQLVKDRKAHLGIKKQHKIIDFGRQGVRTHQLQPSIFSRGANFILIHAVQNEFISHSTGPASASKVTWRFGANGSRTAGAAPPAAARHASCVPFLCLISRRSKADVQISHVLGRALQLHPRHVQLWIDAASWEFEVNGNSSAARVLLQRGIRFNSDSQVLWKEYFRLEVLYCVKLQQRRRVLSSNTETEDKSCSSRIDVPEASGANTTDFPFEVDGSFEVLLQGAVPKAVLKHCATAMDRDIFPSFCKQRAAACARSSTAKC